MATTTTELNTLAEKLFLPSEFLGVFASDTLPKTSGPFHNTALIINTDTQNLPGMHWVAIHTRIDEAYYFDSFGQPPPLIISTWLTKHFEKWTFSSRQVQAMNSNFCGYFCLHFLFLIKQSFFKNYDLDRILDVIYPKSLPFNYYENTVVDFMNTQLLT